jgi:hypothetical protein
MFPYAETAVEATCRVTRDAHLVEAVQCQPLPPSHHRRLRPRAIVVDREESYVTTSPLVSSNLKRWTTAPRSTAVT